MKSLIKYFDFATAVKLTLTLILFLVFNSLEKQILPYSSALLVALLVFDSSIFFTSLLYLSAFLIMGEVGLLGAGAIFLAVIIPIICIYKHYKINSQFEYIAYAFVGMLGFVFLGSSTTDITLEKRIFTAILTALLTLISLISAKAVSQKGLKFKLGFDETLSLCVLIAIFGIGASNLISPFVWKGIAVFLILLVCYMYRTGIATVICAVFGISLAVYYSNLNYISIFLVYGIFCESLSPFSRYASALSILVADYLIQGIFQVYDSYTYLNLISIVSGCFLFCIIPSELLKSTKDKLYLFREKQLVRQTINRNRSALSGKLYDLSTVFTEMASAFDLFEKHSISEDSAKRIMEKDIINNICKNCDNFHKCKKQEQYVSTSIHKMVDIGFAKGKLSLIDMPKELSAFCIKAHNILYGLNKSLADYRTRLIENQNLAVGRQLIASEVLGVAEVLRGLALDTGSLLKFHNKLERKLCDNLYKSGFLVTELLLYGNEDNLSVSLIIMMKEFSLSELQKVISMTLGVQMVLNQRINVTTDKLYLSFIKATEFDAVFGISKVTKDGSLLSGDTYSTTRITNDKILVALSDGMGSGEQAQAISSASLSLIESFYKAGLQDQLILNTVNKLLTINTEDTFTALDICVIDLKTCSADFIKYGSPYGFIINDNGIKIVEGNSLPLGIIDGLKPAVATTTLNDGDIVLLLSDGISDAFSSSGEIIDFLRTLTPKNPQSLSDKVLNMAIELNDGQKKDDMTALAVRVYKKAN
ncbi:MAG: hypothetical protein E7348_04135 [Clostridiales bacterium]|nr:hypothetical protein [Clostridiales bacterium]